MGANTQMYYLNGRIDYNEIVTMPRRTTEPPPPAMMMVWINVQCS